MATKAKVRLGDIEVKAEDLSPAGQQSFSALQFSEDKLAELENMRALLQRAKNSYIAALKKEMISQKAGLLFDDN